MTYRDYSEEQATPVLSEAHRHVKGLWTRARREFGIHGTYEVVFAVLNAESIRKLVQPYSHVIPRREQPPLIVLRVDKDMCSERHAEHLLHHVLPREMAHVVCKINPTLGNAQEQDAGWHRVFKRLGGLDA